MTGWHLGDDALRRYVERTDSLAEGASAEQHLLSCEPCRARVTVAASVTGLSVIDFAAVWDRTRDAVEVPRPPAPSAACGSSAWPRSSRSPRSRRCSGTPA